ncbi:hypothetical protein DEU56DRAFT_62354 [Suillus clintonianus]|uniref:uncharacterized protein n=1 Tax=Suillus clintonianus TaxID=1904413 RepID=UPI001B872058|nr:uncharacterized protein DEU56DRAFT_62354 [Suillus clintonianus]KAG2149378.1 hypothetical protein DEU56DRAFT_62354 [Suillus clintonianus]
MPAPVAVYVVAAIASFAAVYAFHEFVYEPHIAPAIERWAEDFLENRRARRRVPVASTRGLGDGDLGPRGADPKERTAAREQDSIELEGLNLGPVDEWRNEVHRTAPGTGARRRVRVIPDTDEGKTLSISTRTPTRAVSRASSNTASDSEREGNTTIIFAPSSNSSSPPPSPPFGPILPDTPRTSAAYSARPFSPVVRTPVRSRAQSSRSSLRHSNSSSRVSVDVHGRRVDVDVEDEHVDINIFSDASASMHMSANISVVESLSERYPAAPTPPVLLSPPSSHTLLSSPNTDVLSLGSSGSRSGSPFAVLSPPEQRASLSGAASSLSPSMTSEDEFMSFDEGSDGVGERIVSRSGSARSPNPFSDSDEGSDFDSGSEGSWGRVSTGRR